MIVKMSRVEIVGDREFLYPVTTLLYDLGVAHLDTGPETEVLKKPELTEEEREKEHVVIQALSSLREMEKGLGEISEQSEPVEVENPVERLQKLKTEYDQIMRDLIALQRQRSSLEDYRNILQAVLPLVEGKEAADRVFIGITFPRSEARILDLIKEELSELTEGEFELVTTEMKGDRIAGLVVLPKEKADEFRQLIREEGLNELVLPERYRDLELHESLKKIEEDLEELPAQISELEQRLQEFKQTHEEEIQKLKTYFSDQYRLLKARREYPSESQLLFYLQAWVPEKEAEKVRGALKKEFGDAVHVEIVEPAKEEYPKVPVKLENPSIFRPFQGLLRIFQPPIYGTIDPTPLLYLFFPFYFGFMLGDIGYAAIGTLIFGFLWLKAKNNALLKGVAHMFLWAMGWTFLFGILYGEAFGDLGEKLGMHPLVVHRTHEVRPVLAMAVIFGVFQVNLGVFLGFLNHLRLGNKHHAWYELARFIGLLGLSLAFVMPILYLIAGWQGWPPILIKIGIGMLILAIPAVVKLHNFVAPLEILSAMGNMFSYARLMAIGLSSAILGMIANMFGGIIGIFLFGLAVALLFHALNTLLGIFDPTVQGLRLQFVEFFSKFYLTGGRDFQPFKRGGK